MVPLVHHSMFSAFAASIKAARGMLNISWSFSLSLSSSRLFSAKLYSIKYSLRPLGARDGGGSSVAPRGSF